MDTERRLAGFADEASSSIEGQCAVLRNLGWSSIELRTVDEKQIVDLDEKEFEHVLETLDENGISVCSLGSNIANWAQSILTPFEETKSLVERTLPRAKALKASFVRIMSFRIQTDSENRVLEDQNEKEIFRRLRYITDAFADEKIQAVHENCFSYGGLSYEHTLKLLENVPGLRLVFDTGNPPIDIDARTPFPYSYQSSYEFFNAVRPYISHVHIKDSWIGKDGSEHYTFPGEGRGDVERIVTELERDGYDGFYSIEPHMAVVFHDSSVHSSPKERSDNFYEYGRRFEALLERVRKSL
ncbi:MAG: sugar phosphate isomerase/epimerase [Spirochaetales bacterium]|nr:sugar phosphate isomerase/epimerase [Spirochaetales bacterium]